MNHASRKEIIMMPEGRYSRVTSRETGKTRISYILYNGKRLSDGKKGKRILLPKGNEAGISSGYPDRKTSICHEN